MDGINVRYFRVIIAILLLPQAESCQDTCIPVGVAFRSIIPDSSFTATSNDPNYPPKNARLHNKGSWETETKDNGDVEYVQVDLGKVFIICALATQGNSKNPGAQEWVTEYKISTSIDNKIWTEYPNNTSPKLFPGNTDWDTVVKNDLDIPVQAKLIRFIPTEMNNWKCMRVEVYESSVKACQDVAVGVAYKDIIPNSRFSASSFNGAPYAPHGARLHAESGWETRASNSSEYLQIDLGKLFVICALATQGHNVGNAQDWTKEYKISTSVGNTWTDYPSTSSAKLFPGNNDKHTAVKNSLEIPVLAKLIRFIPTKFHNWKALRVEVYGLQLHDFSCRSLSVGVASAAEIQDNDMTSSSKYNTGTPASNGRLGYTAGSSWCSAVSDSSPYLRISLGSPYIICGVATQGDHNTDQWVQTYQIQQSTDGSTFTDYKANNLVKTFIGNFDSNTIVHDTLYEGTIGRSISINPRTHSGSTNCMRTELYGIEQNTVCSKMAVGVSYSQVIPDQRFTASSYYGDDNRYVPSNARLALPDKAWEPKTQNVGDWLQIDLGPVVYVCAVATRGNGYSAKEYVKKYKLRVSLDNNAWNYYQENNADKDFTGNTDKDSIVTNNLAIPIKAKFLRFYPTMYKDYAAMRVEVYGIPAACSFPFGVEKYGNIQDNNMTSSSDLDNTHTASHGRLYGSTSWCSKTSSNKEYLQIDLGKLITLTGIATQGDHTMDKWVKSYTLKYSKDGNLWTTYRQSPNNVIQSNSDKETILVKWLSSPITAKYVKLQPQSWNAAICLRIELYGCTCLYGHNIEDLSNQYLSASTGSQVDLVCKVEDVLIQHIEWYSDGNNITSLSGGITRGVDFVKSVLQVKYTSADDTFKNYQCIKTKLSVTCRKHFICRVKYNQENSQTDGVKGAEVEVILEYPSAFPLSIDSKSNHSVKVSWTPPTVKESQLDIQSYNVQHNTSSGATTVNKSAAATSSTIGGLKGCTYYELKVRAVSKLGSGPWSSVIFRTLSELPKASPLNVQAIADTSTSILINWEPPLGERCPADGYKVIYSLTSGGGGTEVIVNGGDVTSHKITSLKKWTVYYVSVKVRNDQGFGPASAEVPERTKEDAPSTAPTNVKGTALNSSAVKLSWNSIPGGKRNGVIKGYRIWYNKTIGHSSQQNVQVSGESTFLYVVGNLDMCTQYSFMVLAYTIKDGPYSKSTKITTREGSPPAPRNTRIIFFEPNGSTPPQIQLTWDKPVDSNGNSFACIKGYNVSYNQVEDSQTKVKNLGSATLMKANVCGGKKYSLDIYAYTGTAGGRRANNIVLVPIYAPSTKPKVLQHTSHNVTTLRISWQPILSNNGPILKYEVLLKHTNDSVNKKMVNASCDEVPCGGSVSQEKCHAYVHDLPQCTEYNVSVRAYSSAGAGPFSTPITLSTSAPGPPRDLVATSIGTTAVKLKWKEPKPLAKPVEEYTVSYFAKKSYPCSCTLKTSGVSKTTSTTLEFNDLHPDTVYDFTVSAKTVCGSGKKSRNTSITTEIDAPPLPEPGTYPTKTINGTAEAVISLVEFSDISGPIMAYEIIVSKVQKSRRRRSIDKSKLTGYKEAKQKGLSYYITARLIRESNEKLPRSFTLGDNKIYGRYTNVKLEEESKFNVFQRAFTKKKDGSYLPSEMINIASGTGPDSKGSVDPGSNTSWIGPVVGVIFAVIVVAIIVAAVLLWKRRRSKPKTPSENMLNDDLNLNNLGEPLEEKPTTQATSRGVEMHTNAGFIHNGVKSEDDTDLYSNAEAIRHQPIPVNKFNQYVNERRANPDFFKEEFKLLSNGQLSPWEIARDPANKPRNRYANIITYDHSRVILQDCDDGSDYVNASYLQAFDGSPGTYIATQGPTPATEQDFWQMVWQENIKTIVMLTNLVEAGKVKCHKYWPDRKERYRKISVNLHRSDVLADYVIRTFILTKEGESGSRQVSHFQYVSWPDKGVPQHATSVLGFRRKVRSQHASSDSNAALLVHCSAGVGRTGAFIAVDAMLERVKKEKSVDIFNYVQLMRSDRISMVQTEEQYAFVHLAVQEALTCGNTEIPVLNLNIITAKLSKPRPKDNLTGYQVEWKRLNAISPVVTNATSKAGRLEENLTRNRYKDNIPFDSARVFLSQEHQNYINASFGNAYRERNAFIMAQAPMDNTIADFWYMIYQYKVGSIVTLNRSQEDNETFPQYWPSKGTETHGDITVEFVSTETTGPLVTTECVITLKSDTNNPQNFIHIQHTDWPSNGVPSDCQSVLNIVDAVQKSQQKSGNAPIVVQCSDGVGRSGTFCAIYSLLERVKSEQVIDVFQAIKVLRLGRPNAVASLEQYQFCYKMVQKYLDSFNDYANFSDV